MLQQSLRKRLSKRRCPLLENSGVFTTLHLVVDNRLSILVVTALVLFGVKVLKGISRLVWIIIILVAICICLL